MSITIITSKGFSVRQLEPIFRQRFPHETLDFPVIHLAGFYYPPLPRGLKWSDYPHLTNLDEVRHYQTSTLGGALCEPYLLRSEPGQSTYRVAGQRPYEAVIEQADQLYSAVDPSPSECWAVEVLRQRFGKPQIPFGALELYAFTQDHLQHALDRSDDLGWFFEQANQGRVKAYFDHQFRVNSLAVMGRTFAQPGEPAAWVSKYQLLTLFFLARHPGMTVGDLLQRMEQWTGTGKHPGTTSIGGAASRMAIVEQLEKHGWLARMKSSTEKPSMICPSAAGADAVQALHPDCYDPDLPFRIQSWMAAGFAASRPAMDRYIRTLFGKQKRFLERMRSHELNRVSRASGAPLRRE